MSELPNTTSKFKVTESDILLDIYFYQKELELVTLKEDKEVLLNKIKEAEQLIKDLNL